MGHLLCPIFQSTLRITITSLCLGVDTVRFSCLLLCAQNLNSVHKASPLYLYAYAAFYSLHIHITHVCRLDKFIASSGIWSTVGSSLRTATWNLLFIIPLSHQGWMYVIVYIFRYSHTLCDFYSLKYRLTGNWWTK